MNAGEALRLIAEVADDPPGDVREVRPFVPRHPRGTLPAPLAAELRMRDIRVPLGIIPDVQRTALILSHDTAERRYRITNDAQR